MLIARSISLVSDGHPRLSDVSLDIAPGEVVGLSGPSGSGKSSLLRCLALLEPSATGKVQCDGVFAASPNWKVAGWSPRVALVFQRLFLWPNLTNQENILLDLRVSPAVARHFRALCDRVSVSSLLSKRPQQCSLGEQQRIALIRALVRQPQYLLLDEITSAQDGANVLAIQELLGEFQQAGGSLLLVSHNAEMLLALATRQLRMVSGRIHNT